MTKTWLISTGAGTPTRPLAEAVLAAGGRLVVAAASPADLAELADLADPAPERVVLAVLDPADPASAVDAVRTAVDAFGRLDVVVSGPGALTAPVPLGACVQDVRLQLDAVLLGTVALARAALPVFRGQRSGSFLHLAAPAAAAGVAGSAPAAAAHRAVEAYLEALHQEERTSGVRVTIAQPGAVAGDPVRVARVLADVVTLEQPPLRLALGAQALQAARQSLRGRLEELEVWAGVSRATDVAGTPVRSTDRPLASVLHLAAPAA